MSGEALAIEQHFNRLVRLGDRLAAANAPSRAGWQLVPGITSNGHRTAWVMTDRDGVVVLVLGYTKRETVAALAAINNALAALLGA